MNTFIKTKGKEIIDACRSVLDYEDMTVVPDFDILQTHNYYYDPEENLAKEKIDAIKLVNGKFTNIPIPSILIINGEEVATISENELELELKTNKLLVLKIIPEDPMYKSFEQVFKSEDQVLPRQL